jgi:transcriptional regulator GlxA family with amidase domain
MCPERHRVAVVALPGVYSFEMSIPGRLFGAATTPDGRAPYDVITCSVDGRPVVTNADFAVVVRHDLSVLARADTVIVPPFGATLSAEERDEVSDTLALALRDLRPGTRVASICTGAEALARAGLLNSKRATTHWRNVHDFQRDYPTVQVDGDVLYVDAGDVLTSAGAAAGIDLCLHLIRRDFGADVANTVARLCVVPPHRDGGQAQYIARPVPPVNYPMTATAREFALENLDRRLPLTVWADRASMSVRTFTRIFRDEVGCSPGKWITQQRVDLARRLLETTDLPVDQVAAWSGLGTAVSLRLHLKAAVGVSPLAYRRTFGANKRPSTPADTWPSDNSGAGGRSRDGSDAAKRQADEALIRIADGYPDQ